MESLLTSQPSNHEGIEVEPPLTSDVTDEGCCTEEDGDNDQEKVILGMEKDTTNVNDVVSQSQESSSFFLVGMKEDIRARWPLYGDDWKIPTTSKKDIITIGEASIFAFCIQIVPALIFAEIIERQTYGNISTAEVLVSTGMVGILYAICSGQPIVIMGITGPIAVLLGTSYTLTQTFQSQYFPFFFWTCIWTGVLHIISAVFGLVRLIRHVTPFTSQIFEFFIGITFVYGSLSDLILPLQLLNNETNDDNNNSNVITSEERSIAYASFFIGLLTCYIAWVFHFAETSVYGISCIRSFLTSYNTVLAIVIGTAVSYIPGIDQRTNGENDDGGSSSGIARVTLKAPWDWQPTADRSWIVNPFIGIDVRGIFGAFIPGFMFFLLFIIDHNVSSILSQSTKFNLKKPSAYHWDFFILGITCFPCALLGVPPGNALIPQSPLHVRALCQRKRIIDSHGVERIVYTNCQEQRWSGLIQACLHFVALLCFKVLNWIPKGSLFGLLLYLGIGALHGNEIWERCCMVFMIAKKRPQIPIVRNVQWSIVSTYTLIQVLCAFAIFAVANFANSGYIYPILLALLVPFRSYVLSRVFTSNDLKYLDPFGEPQEEYREEQQEYHKALHHMNLINEDDMAYPTFSEYRGGGDSAADQNKQL